MQEVVRENKELVKQERKKKQAKEPLQKWNKEKEEIWATPYSHPIEIEKTEKEEETLANVRKDMDLKKVEFINKLYERLVRLTKL